MNIYIWQVKKLIITTEKGELNYVNKKYNLT